eukprot:CAMPEP_0198197726 /NCGR_PEP_ID=MMETSP1445-20131203/1279_1 /TAXON_ID=36898 /ORGANISM="Pyramimonas sp., Strain CCMP2087" /LENGTH=41 /DNA_ID= /DNA_START= /DNA_END= /DNA_ORIENTATION=
MACISIVRPYSRDRGASVVIIRGRLMAAYSKMARIPETEAR